MIRRLSMKGRPKRSASIAVPMGHRMFDDANLQEEEDDDDEDDENGDNDDVDYDGDDARRRRPKKSTKRSRTRPASSSLARSKSERHYQSTGNVRAWTESDLQDLSADSWQRYYLRCFSVTPKGVVSRGDYVRYRRVGRSLSVVASKPDRLLVAEDSSTKSPSTAAAAAALLTVPGDAQQNSNRGGAGASTATASSSTASDFGIEEFIVYVVGSSGVGKTALTHQFTTSEHILNSKETGDTDDRAVTISLDGEESRLIFRELKSAKVTSELKRICEPLPCAFLVVYSVTQVDSFLVATHILSQLHQDRIHEDKVVVLVGNKSELVRSRVVHADEGHALASRYKVKFIETSVGINYNVDELVVGVLTNLRVALQRRTRHGGQRSSTWPNRFNRARTSLRRMFDRMLHGKDHDHHHNKNEQQTQHESTPAGCEILVDLPTPTSASPP